MTAPDMSAAKPERLLLLRHAKSSWQFTQLADHDRPLNGRGRSAAISMGLWIAENNLTPDLALVSTSKRTRETWSRVEQGLPVSPEVIYERALYHGNPQGMFELLRTASAASRRVLVLGHNPGMALLAHALANADGAPLSGSRFLKFPTAGLAVFKIRAESWSSLSPESAELERFVDPRSLA